MQKILISGHNPTFKNNFMNSLQFKKTIVTLDGYDGAVKSSHINYYAYFRRYNDEQLIELIKNLLYVHEIPHAEIIFVENYLLFLKKLMRVLNKNMTLLDAFIQCENYEIVKQEFNKLLQTQTIDFSVFDYYMNQYIGFHTPEFISIEMFIVLLFKNTGCPSSRCSTIQLDEINQDVHLYLINEMMKVTHQPLILIEDHKQYNTQTLKHFFEMNKEDYPLIAIFKDIFLHEELISQIPYLFSTKIYLNHSEHSANIISQLAGEVEVVHTTSTISRNKRIGSESLLDRLFGTDKTETVATLAPVKEPKISKEEIMYLNKNVCLLQTYDSTLRLFVWSNKLQLLLKNTNLIS